MDWVDQQAQPNHPHSHSSEARSSGWIMDKILITGVTIKLKWLTLEFHISLPLKLSLHTVWVVQWDQPTHLLSHLLEVRNNGWTMDRISTTGVTIKSMLLTREFHMPLLFKLELRDQLSMVSVDQWVQPTHPHSHLSEERSNGWITLKISATGETSR